MLIQAIIGLIMLIVGGGGIYILIKMKGLDTYMRTIFMIFTGFIAALGLICIVTC